MRLPLTIRKEKEEKLQPLDRSYYDKLLALLREVSLAGVLNQDQINQLNTRLVVVNSLSNWLVKENAIETAEGMKIKLWSAEKEFKDEKIRSITNAPLHVLVTWMIGQGLVNDLTYYLVKTVSNRTVFYID